MCYSLLINLLLKHYNSFHKTEIKLVTNTNKYKPYHVFSKFF